MVFVSRNVNIWFSLTQVADVLGLAPKPKSLVTQYVTSEQVAPSPNKCKKAWKKSINKCFKPQWFLIQNSVSLCVWQGYNLYAKIKIDFDFSRQMWCDYTKHLIVLRCIINMNGFVTLWFFQKILFSVALTKPPAIRARESYSISMSMRCMGTSVQHSSW